MSENDTLKNAQNHLRANWKKGTNCECCGQFVKLYKRRLHSTMVIQLIFLYKQPADWVHLKEIVMGLKLSGGGDFSKMAFWGLIENKINTDPTKKDSGLWRITEKGKDFIKGCTATLPKYVNIYNGQSMGFSEERTTIQGALGKGFDFNELMNN